MILVVVVGDADARAGMEGRAIGPGRSVLLCMAELAIEVDLTVKGAIGGRTSVDGAGAAVVELSNNCVI